MKRTRKHFFRFATVVLTFVFMALNAFAVSHPEQEPKPEPHPGIPIILDRQFFYQLKVLFQISLESELTEVNFEDGDHFEYTGEPVMPKVKVIFEEKELKEKRDYTITYENNEDVGTGEVIIKGKGIFSGEIRKNFYIELSGKAIVDYALQFVGCPYVYGGTTEAGFDCSGFVQSVYGHFGIGLPRTSYDQRNVGTYVSSLDELQVGDILVFYGGGHVGLYLGNGEFIHAANSRVGVIVSSFYGDANTYDHYAQAFVSAARIL